MCARRPFHMTMSSSPVMVSDISPCVQTLRTPCIYLQRCWLGYGKLLLGVCWMVTQDCIQRQNVGWLNSNPQFLFTNKIWKFCICSSWLKVVIHRKKCKLCTIHTLWTPNNSWLRFRHLTFRLWVQPKCWHIAL